VDSLLKDVHAAMWKLDVEGSEGQVLAGATNSLLDPSLAVVLIEGETENTTRLLRKSGFGEASYDGFTRQLSHRRAAPGQFCNHLWVRNIDKVQEKCRSGPRYTILSQEV
jgi:hypothetical protein